MNTATRVVKADPVVILTGLSGCGKSHLVARLKTTLGTEIFVVDPLVAQPGAFMPPASSPKVVVLDHAEFTHDATTYCNAMIHWGKNAKVLVMIVTFKTDDLRARGIDLPEQAVGVELLGRGGDKGVVVTLGGEKRTFMLDEFAEFLSDLEVAVEIERVAAN